MNEVGSIFLDVSLVRLLSRSRGTVSCALVKNKLVNVFCCFSLFGGMKNAIGLNGGRISVGILELFMQLTGGGIGS